MITRPTTFRYVGQTVTPRADGLSSPLPHGAIVYLEGTERQRGFVIANLRPDLRGASFRLRARDLAAAS
jgi:hypothetical protein